MEYLLLNGPSVVLIGMTNVYKLIFAISIFIMRISMVARMASLPGMGNCSYISPGESLPWPENYLKEFPQDAQVVTNTANAEVTTVN